MSHSHHQSASGAQRIGRTRLATTHHTAQTSREPRNFSANACDGVDSYSPHTLRSTPVLVALLPGHRPILQRVNAAGMQPLGNGCAAPTGSICEFTHC